MKLLVTMLLLVGCTDPSGDAPGRYDPLPGSAEEASMNAVVEKGCRERHRGDPNIDCFCEPPGESIEGC